VPLAWCCCSPPPTSPAARNRNAARSALDLSRALAIAVDAELQSTIALLQNLAIATQLEAREPAELGGNGFAQLARRLVMQQGWRNLLVADAPARS
jgi:hypothetical protein